MIKRVLHVSDIMSNHLVTVKRKEKASVVASKLLKLGVESVLVLDEAEQVCGLTIIGTRGLGGFKNSLLGSVSSG